MIRSSILAALMVLVAGCASTPPSGPTRQETMQSVKKDLIELQSMLEAWPKTLAKRAQSKYGFDFAYKGSFKKYGGAKALDKDAPLYAGASKDRSVIALMNKGIEYEVLDKQGAWYGVSRGKDAGWVQASDVVLVGQSQTEVSGITDWLREKAEEFVEAALDRLSALRQKYENNPFVRIKGFKVSLTAGVLPTLELEFEFK